MTTEDDGPEAGESADRFKTRAPMSRRSAWSRAAFSGAPRPPAHHRTRWAMASAKLPRASGAELRYSPASMRETSMR